MAREAREGPKLLPKCETSACHLNISGDSLVREGDGCWADNEQCLLVISLGKMSSSISDFN